jgi:hypothetical protein
MGIVRSLAVGVLWGFALGSIPATLCRAEAAGLGGVNQTEPNSPSPVRGQIQGQPFRYERATLREGILKLRQGEEFFADLELTVFLFLDEKGVIPEDRVWNITCETGWRGGYPHIHVARRKDGKKPPEHASVTCDYALRLEFGKETAQGSLPGTIALRAPSLGTHVVGSFEATIKGYRLKEGQVDLTQDDLDIAAVVAKRWLSARVGEPVELVDRGLGWIHTEAPEDRPQAGFSVYWWRPRNGRGTRVAKLQFEKRHGTWQVVNSLEPWQVAAARPNSPRRDLMASFDLRAARRFEQEHLAAHGTAPVFVGRVRSSYNPKSGVAETVLDYALDEKRARRLGRLFPKDSSAMTVRYLFRTTAGCPACNEPESWRLERRLADDEVVDFKTGNLVPR